MKAFNLDLLLAGLRHTVKITFKIHCLSSKALTWPSWRSQIVSCKDVSTADPNWVSASQHWSCCPVHTDSEAETQILWANKTPPWSSVRALFLNQCFSNTVSTITDLTKVIFVFDSTGVYYVHQQDRKIFCKR